MSSKKLTADAELETLQRASFNYFLYETNPVNGLVIDKTDADWPASIAATGLALAAYPVGVERGLMSRAAAVERTLVTLRFFWNSPQSPEPDATGYQGFYYHFLDLQTGRRAWQCELSTIDSALLLAGALMAAMYFEADTGKEHELNEGPTVLMIENYQRGLLRRLMRSYLYIVGGLRRAGFSGAWI